MLMKRKMNVAGKNFKKKNRKKVSLMAKRCRFCYDSELKNNLDYKNASLLKGFLTDSGNILSARISGNCHSCQKLLTSSIKLSRTMALIEFCAH